MTEQQAKFELKVFEILLSLASVVGVGLGSWSLFKTNAHDNELAAIRASRFTSADGSNLKADLIEKMSDPPRWLEEKLDVIEDNSKIQDKRYEELRGQLVEINRKLDKLGQ